MVLYAGIKARVLLTVSPSSRLVCGHGVLFSRSREPRDGAGEGARHRTRRQWAAGTARLLDPTIPKIRAPRTPRSPFPAGAGQEGWICRWELGVPRGGEQLPGLCWGQGTGRGWGRWSVAGTRGRGSEEGWLCWEGTRIVPGGSRQGQGQCRVLG